MEKFGMRDEYVNKDSSGMVPEVVDNKEERLQRAAEIKASNFIEKYSLESWQLTSDAESSSTEDRKEVFSESVLSRLDTETYMKLWSLASPHYLSHVSRHGFRDHAGMVYHTGGLDEFSDSAYSLMTDSKQLRSPFGSRGLFGMPEKVKNELKREVFSESEPTSREDAEKALHLYFNHSLASAPYFPDKTAVHLAAETVADSLYGGESGNEVFVVFPADFIASQHAFAFNTGEAGWTFTKPLDSLKWNDVFVWTDKFGGGISLDSGITFLPKTTMVDPETGSRYASETQEGQQTQIEDEKIISTVLDHFSKPGYFDDTLDRDDFSVKQEQIDVVKQSLITLGLYERAEELLGEQGCYDLTRSISRMLLNKESTDKASAIVELLKSKRLTNKLMSAENNGVEAEQFWEQYFVKYPNRRPKHVVFYDGNPEEAVNSLLKQNDVRPKSSKSEPLLGFDKNLVENLSDDPRSNPGREAIDSLCEEILDEMFSKTN